MRWLIIDEFTAIKKGKFACGIKCVTRADESLTQTYPAVPVLSPSLMCEMMAQVGGVIIGATIDFTKEVVLAKISQADFKQRVSPPAMLEIEGRLEDLGDSAARTHCTIKEHGNLVAEGDMFFGLFDQLQETKGKPIVFSESFMKTFSINRLVVK